MSALVFIDTNILLDFYEVDSGDATLPLLKHIQKNHDKLITTSEVEMEFKKNRQRIILKSLNSLKLNKAELISIPAFLRGTKLNLGIKDTQEKLKAQSAALTERAIKILKYPKIHDPVYRTLESLFRDTQFCHLSRDKKLRYDIRRLARKRFSLGYPPRKDSDISLIDSINWEWIIHCAYDSKRDIVIVSRDKDYGEHYGKESILNDWLQQEFKERVSRKRKISLTTRLSEAFKLASITVSEKEEQSELELIQSKYIDNELNKIESINLNELFSSSPFIQDKLKNIDASTINEITRRVIHKLEANSLPTDIKPSKPPNPPKD